MKNKKRYQFKRSFIRSIERKTIRQIVFLSKHEATEQLITSSRLKHSDRFFAQSTNMNDSYLNRGVWLNEAHLPDAYFDTAILLITMIQLTNSNGIRDGYIFPALFCYRHYLELTMKDSLNRFEGNGGLDDLVVEREHSLCKLWNKLKRYIGDGEEKEIVQNRIFEFNNIDPNGELFRYPYEISKEGWQLPSSLPSGLHNIKKLKETMIKVYQFLEGINSLAYNY